MSTAEPTCHRAGASLRRGMAHDASVMRAAFFSDRGFEVRATSRPFPGPEEVLVEVEACGICGSDLHFFSHDTSPPRVCAGHEICGRVASRVPGLDAGLPVVVEPIVACGNCRGCRGAEPNLCAFLQVLGRDRPGGFADAVVVPRTSVYAVPPGLDLDTAMLTEPLAVAAHAVQLVPITSGSRVLVIGGGTIGLLTAFLAARAGAEVTASIRYRHQRETAFRLGASRVFSSDEDASRTEDGPDVVFETVGGRAATLDLALARVRPGGAIVTLGVFSRPLMLDSLTFLAKEIRIVSSTMYSRKGPTPDFVAALEILRCERDRLAPLITHRVSLAEIQRGFALASDKQSGAIKVAVRPDQKL